MKELLKVKCKHFPAKILTCLPFSKPLQEIELEVRVSEDFSKK